MYVAVTRYTADPHGADRARTRAIQDATGGTPGALGATIFRSAADPTQMMRITWWESLEVRDWLHASAAGRGLGLGEGPPREFYELLYDGCAAARHGGAAFVVATRYQGDPADGDGARAQAADAASRDVPGALGRMVFRATTDPAQRLRLTWWASLTAREQFHASAAARTLDRGTSAASDVYQLVQDRRQPAAR